MDNGTHIVLASKLLEICGQGKNSVIYSILPNLDKEPVYFKGVYTHNLENLPIVLDSTLEIFSGKRTNVAKNSYIFTKIKENKDEFMNCLGLVKDLINYKESKIGDNKVNAALCLVSHLYFDSFTQPLQVFIPHASPCSGQWFFWDKINYLSFKESFNQKNFFFDFRKKIIDSDVWNFKPKPKDFPLIIQRRLTKEKLFNKPLSPESMIKAMIIRLGEMAKPDINYEIIDYSIRSFFTYLGVKQYLRVDREIMFLRRLEEEIKTIVKGLL